MELGGIGRFLPLDKVFPELGKMGRGARDFPVWEG
jgi:hypothetical protein